MIRHRLTAGLRHKAAKGELRQGLPVGFVYDEADHVVMDPNEAVIEAIATVLRRFDELGSARQVMLSLRGDGVLIPRRPTGAKRVSWAPATYPAIHDFLTNPTYAGAFVFGRTRTEKRLDAGGRLVSRTRQLPRQEWSVLIPDHHAGFLSWERFEQTQDQLRANWRPPRGQGGGAVREGAALLQGLLRCGRCGRMMQTGYSGTKGNCPRYTCARAAQLYGAERHCQSLGGRRLEQRVLDEVFAVLAPAALAATAKALGEAEAQHRQRLAVFELAVERARFEAERARRQFDAVEPENRLVGRTLEKAWEAALTAQRQAEADLTAQRARQPTRLSDDEVAWLSRAGADVRAVFNAASTTWRVRKQLLRAVIVEIVVTVRITDRQADVQVIWEGGATNGFVLALNKTGGHFRATDEDTVALVRRLAERYDDATIAAILAKQGRRTGTGLAFNRSRVNSLRNSNGIAVFVPSADVAPADDDGEVVTVYRAEKLLGVDKSTIYRWLKDGFIDGEQLTPGGPWHLRITDRFREQIVPEVPDGWVDLAQAAKALGVARQTVLHKVQRGELEAVHVNRGKRKGLRIKVPSPSAGLFATPQ